MKYLLNKDTKHNYAELCNRALVCGNVNTNVSKFLHSRNTSFEFILGGKNEPIILFELTRFYLFD
jgi:hypothetical protein